jgi:hypothetical protein
MMTLRIGSKSSKTPDLNNKNNKFIDSPVLSCSDCVLGTDFCPRCRHSLTLYQFTTADGLSIITYHCREHGDVIPLRDTFTPARPPITEEVNRGTQS